MNKNTKVAFVVIGIPLSIFLVVAYRRLVPPNKPRLAPASMSQPAGSDNRDNKQPTVQPPTILHANKNVDDLPTYTPTTRDDSPADRPFPRDSYKPLTPNLLSDPITGSAPVLDPDSLQLFPAPSLGDSPQSNSPFVEASDDMPLRPGGSFLPPSDSPPTDLLPTKTDINQSDPPQPKQQTTAPPPRQQLTRADDSFWEISLRAYNTGLYYRALYKHNQRQIPRPDQIPAGVKVDVPSREELRRLYPELCPKEEGSSEGARGRRGEGAKQLLPENGS